MSDIVERLGYHHEHPIHGTMVLRNPDGPEAADTITTLRADLQKLNERNAEYIGTIDRLRRRVAETDVEIERLRAALDVVRASGLLIGSTTLHDRVRSAVYNAIDADHWNSQATAAIDLIRAEVLEEAAGVADVYGSLTAAAIRALKGDT